MANLLDAQPGQAFKLIQPNRWGAYSGGRHLEVVYIHSKDGEGYYICRRKPLMADQTAHRDDLIPLYDNSF